MRSRFWAILGLAVAGAQGGHELAYRLKFGAASQQVQATGAHEYFPLLLKTALGAVALGLIGALLVVGVARVVANGTRVRAEPGPSFVTVLAMLFTLQLAWFMGQEVTEAMVAGVPPPSAADLLLWGMVGQLPVAFAGATVLAWLGRRVEFAVAVLASLSRAAAPLVIAPPLAPQPVMFERAVALAHIARSPIVKRGPPQPSSFRPF